LPIGLGSAPENFRCFKIVLPIIRIEFFAQDEVQIVVGQSQFTKYFRSLRLNLGLLHAFGHSTKPQAQRDSFIFVAKFSQELPDFFRASSGLLDHSQRVGNFRFRRINTFEQGAIECATLFRSIRINPTMTSVESDARLRKFPDGIVFRIALSLFQQKPQRFETLNAIAPTQLHVSENHAVATEAASEAKFFAD
jgi:hypothetical protein